ncbi:MAG: endopeptidase La [Acidimicrobiia bacterium]
MVVNVAVESAEARAAIAAASRGDGTAVVVPKVDGVFAAVGTLAKVEAVPAVGETQLVMLRGLERVMVGAGELGDGEALWVGTTSVDEGSADPARVDTLSREYKALAAEVLEARRIGRMADVLADIDDPSTLADTAVYSPDLSLEQKVMVLETVDVADRLELVCGFLRETLADLHLREKVREQVSEGMEKQQREFLLRRQMDAIREELGEADGDAGAEYRSRIAAADLPETVTEAALREVDRLERMGESNPEHGWVRTWLDTVLEVPWSVHTEDCLDLGAAREVLDADHYGLDDVKDRIGEFLGVRKLRAERGLGDDDGDGNRRRGSGAILALVGPPGVGKTSLGESVARALGREFVRVALGGVRDEAEIRGHRRTYVGAQPGRIVRALREAGTMNPVFLLDEVDKVASDWRGDPSAALLEVLDPAQNHTFRDHYLELDLDLSEVLFIATANVLETIPEPLLNRMEVIRLDGYSDDEKQAIARTHLLPRQESLAGLVPGELEVTDAALAEVVSRYTQEAGVRTLERRLGTIARKTATRIATSNEASDTSMPIVVDHDDVREYLGRPKVHHEVAEREPTPGVVTGLAVTGAGGDVLFVEATVMDGEAGLTLTGQLGDVMKESATIALSYVRAHAAELGIGPDALANRHVHLHVPAGAVPKDGPSAGITMVSALVSLLTSTPADPTVAMTGEVNLQGQVLPIGGVKQKLLAAHRAGIRTVVLSRRNEDDLEDVPDHVLDELDVRTVDHVDAVLDAVLVRPTPGAAPTGG